MLNELNNKVMSTQTQADPYNKVIATIKSCKTKNQLEGASRMVENFKTLYKKVGYPKVLSYIIDKTLKEQYIKIRCQL
mgnify:CR=1 FL=1